MVVSADACAERAPPALRHTEGVVARPAPAQLHSCGVPGAVGRKFEPGRPPEAGDGAGVPVRWSNREVGSPRRFSHCRSKERLHAAVGAPWACPPHRPQAEAWQRRPPLFADVYPLTSLALVWALGRILRKLESPVQTSGVRWWWEVGRGPEGVGDKYGSGHAVGIRDGATVISVAGDGAGVY